MPNHFEHWTQIRTPEQFDIYFDCIKEVASEAKAGLVQKDMVAGYEEFKQHYNVPVIELEIDELTINLSGESSNLYGLAAFLDDQEGLAFNRLNGGYTKTAENSTDLSIILDDLEELTSLWGWQLNK